MIYQTLRHKFLFLLVLTSISIFAGSALAQDITVTAPTLSVGPGTTFVVSITASNTTGFNFTGFDAQIQFDPSVIQYVGCTNTGTIWTDASVFCNVFPTPNMLRVNNSAITPAVGAGSILNISFKAVGASGTSSPVIFNSMMLNEGDPTNATVNGIVNLLEPSAAGVNISGRIFNRFNRPLSRARILLTDSDGVQRTAISNPFGYFTFRDVPAGRDYILDAIAKGSTFSPQLISLVDNVSDIVLSPDTGFNKGFSKGRPAPLN